MAEADCQTMTITGMSDGMAINSTIIGQQNINGKQVTDNVRKRTQSRLASWTRGMVKTAGLQKILKNVSSGSSWITIQGSPGEGKTTAAYMALEELQNSGRSVFQVTTPEEFSEVSVSCSSPVVMLDDIFGELMFDENKWTKWSEVLHAILDEKEHRSQEHGKTRVSFQCTVICVGRDYIFASASRHMGRLSDFVTRPEYIVDLSSQSSDRDLKEKLTILGAIMGDRVVLDEDTVSKMCQIKTPHGFPHVCRMFATLYKEDKGIDAEIFFEYPLKFLTQTLRSFMDNKVKRKLFSVLVKSDGKATERDLRNFYDNPDIVHEANDLLGTYLKKEDDFFIFDHPSILDCVSCLICQEEPLFVIQQCSMAFINQRVRIQSQGSEEPHDSKDDETPRLFFISASYLQDMAKRFTGEIEIKNLVYVLSHELCRDENFVKQMMENITLPFQKVLKMNDWDSHESFLFLIASNKSRTLLKYIMETRKVKLFWKNLEAVQFGICKYAASDALRYLIDSGVKLNLESRYGTRKMTSLMLAAETRDEEFVQQILELDPKLTASDSAGCTVMNYLALNDLVSAIEWIYGKGRAENPNHVWANTPLNYACGENNEMVVKLLLDKGAKVDSWAVHTTCKVGNLTILKMLFEKGATVDMLAENVNETPLDTACRYGQVEVMDFLIAQGAPVKDSTYNLSLHLACLCDQPKPILCLLKHGAVINHHGKGGNTPLHAAALNDSYMCMEVLIDAGGNVNPKNDNSNTPLHTAVSWPPSDKCASMLIGSGADVNAQNKNGNTPLHLAVMEVSVKCLNVLLSSTKTNAGTDAQGTAPDNTADVNMRNHEGQTALHLAVTKEGRFGRHDLPHFDVCQLLINNDADVNVTDVNGNSPLHLLSRISKSSKIDHEYHFSRASAHPKLYRSIIVLLVDAKADVDMLNRNKQPALRGWCKTLYGNESSCILS